MRFGVWKGGSKGVYVLGRVLFLREGCEKQGCKTVKLRDVCV